MTVTKIRMMFGAFRGIAPGVVQKDDMDERHSRPDSAGAHRVHGGGEVVRRDGMLYPVQLKTRRRLLAGQMRREY